MVPPSLCAFVDLITSSTSDTYFFPYLVALEGFTESLRKEMPSSSEWNIQAIIEPGGFKPKYGLGAMTTLPLLPTQRMMTTIL
jgi:hypothetical protein